MHSAHSLIVWWLIFHCLWIRNMVIATNNVCKSKFWFKVQHDSECKLIAWGRIQLPYVFFSLMHCSVESQTDSIQCSTWLVDIWTQVLITKNMLPWFEWRNCIELWVSLMMYLHYMDIQLNNTIMSNFYFSNAFIENSIENNQNPLLYTVIVLHSVLYVEKWIYHSVSLSISKSNQFSKMSTNMKFILYSNPHPYCIFNKSNALALDQINFQWRDQLLKLGNCVKPHKHSKWWLWIYIVRQN